MTREKICEKSMLWYNTFCMLMLIMIGILANVKRHKNKTWRHLPQWAFVLWKVHDKAIY